MKAIRRALLALLTCLLIVAAPQGAARGAPVPASAMPAPAGLQSAAASTTSVTVRWKSRGSGIRYRVSFDTTSTFAHPQYVRETSTSRRLDGLRPNTRYYVKVRVISPDGDNLSAYSAPIAVSTKALPAPDGLQVTATSRHDLALAWRTVDGAERYRVQYSKSATMSGATYRRFTGTTAEVAGLTANATYYVKVRAITAAGVSLSSYSPAIRVKTANDAARTYLPPSRVTAEPADTDRLAVSWGARGAGLRYQVEYSAASDLRDPVRRVTGSTSLTLAALRPGTTYYVRVRLVSASGAPLSAPSPTVTVSTRSADLPTIKVASYNIKCTNCFSGLRNEGTWYQRRDAVVATVLGQRPDVIGFQEASQGWLKDSAGRPVSKSQFEDLVERLGAPYKLTNTARNNCVKSSTPTRCVYADQGASQGTKIVYNSAALDLIDQGSELLPKAKQDDPDRYVSWAILEHKQTGRRFFFADTHLEFHADAAGSRTYYNLRIAQTRAAAALFASKSKGLPGYFVGDFNSHKWTKPSNGPYDVLTKAGLVDPLGNTYRSTRTASGIVTKRIRTNFSSFNGFAAIAPSFSYLNGTYIDYIWVTRGIKVPEWETVVDVDRNNRFVGTIPSDHNMIRATTRLP